jgi:hypothetical protein
MRKLIIGVLFCFLTLPGASAGPDGCRDAVDKFKSARGDVADALRSYASCVSGSDGHEDCSTEFSSLNSEHDDFESAVSEYESECN